MRRLALCNVYEIDDTDAAYKRTLAPNRREADEWKAKLTELLVPLAGNRPFSKARFNKLARLAGAKWLVKR